MSRPHEICLPGDVINPFNNDEELKQHDLLQYILFSDLTDTLGSILSLLEATVQLLLSIPPRCKRGSPITWLNASLDN
ncbi:MAG: hypothetical protein R2788_17985 [Saprospiraceae bacterium]